jgi:hypothetical protein
VTPVDTVTVHSDSAARIAVAAVNVMVAVAVYVLEPAAVKVVDPHPAVVVMPDGVLTKRNVGSSSATVSDTSNGVFNLNVYEIDVGRSVDGSAISSLLNDNAGTTISVDFRIGVAAIFATVASLRVT